MLRNTRYFYTWDLVSQTNVDALFCGAIPVVSRWAPFTEAICDSEFGAFPYAELIIKNAAIIVAHNHNAFEEKRRTYLDRYGDLHGHDWVPHAAQLALGSSTPPTSAGGLLGECLDVCRRFEGLRG